MKEHNLPFESFVGGWYISEDICDDLICVFERNKHLTKEGTVSYTESKIEVDKDVKESLDLCIAPDNTDPTLMAYKTNLQIVLNHYLQKYPEANAVSKFSLSKDYNIQYYTPGGGFKTWHNERSSDISATRHLVFMTYLNNVYDGGTEFKYQNLKVPAVKGLTLIWPTDWTHTHRGVISQTQEKYIITGWFNFS
jgi:hypothetical protein